MFRKLIATSSTWFTVPVRLALGAVFIAHGSQKVLGSFNGPGFKTFTAGNTPFAFMRPTWLWLALAAFADFFGGRGEAMTQDASALAGAVTTAAPNPADYVVLPQTISKEPLGPFTRNGDEVWSDIITWLHYGLIEAEELGVTQANVEEMTKSQTPAIQRLLGASGDLGSRLGLDNKWLVTAIKVTGNYGEIYERNVGKASPLKLDRGLNGLWNKGGLMYSVPFK